MSLKNNGIISEGDTALAYSADQKRYHTFQVKICTSVRLWKHTVNTEGAIGHYYGSRFVIRGCSLELFDPNKLEVRLEQQLPSEDNDNRNLLDVASNQKYSTEDIQELKENELAGEQLITEIISGSNTFNEKSQFSKQKYLTRKRAKHLPVIFIYRPSLRHLSLMHYHLRPEKIGFLRIDTLSLLLSLANVRYGSRLLVVDNFGGLVIGAVLERMGGGGRLVELFTTEIIHPRPVLSSFSHLSSLHWECLSAFPLRRLARLREYPQTPQLSNSEQKTNNTAQQPISSLQQSADSLEESSIIEIDVNITQNKSETPLFEEQHDHTPPKEDRYCTARELLIEGEFEGIILASKHDPVPILEACLPFISSSSPLLVYCVFPELISNCNEYFHSSNNIILKNLTTSWLRAYQPAESKLHPEMMSSSCRTGYVLSGVRVKTYTVTPTQSIVTPEADAGEERSPDSKRAKLL
ncbi:tRNA (adenine(58)-N(1))-methyltransferase non-catalytic subunit TRM6 isoform X1 [Oopsacas minuta]|uniref:tRNA (adenine(58)-N(1))-methyltransferase non-catalytic subunit TRM6 n=1 Tax=Oopsacas minuta TaxID=111878 RepID=A0AAV7JP69_9METZ|nr:tRNA (adenine(58)-N(1))-methyltransferase non-catalytic subunit TRM6 isoform X1 [Oopsacas minuta]